MKASVKTRLWNPAWQRALVLFAAALSGVSGLLQCQLANEPRRENYVSVKLDDSLKRYDSVEILILAAKDTSQVIGTVWSGPLAEPSRIQDYRLADGENRALAIRVRGFDAGGTLLLDMLISKSAGGQSVEHLPVPQPAPAPSARLASFHCSPGALIPAFDSSHYDYVVELPNADSSLVLTAIPNHPQAAMTLGAAPLASGKASAGMPLKVGANDFSLRVAAGRDSAVYTLKAIRAAFVPPDSVPTDTTHPDTIGHPTGGPVDSAFQAWKHGGYLKIDLKPLALSKKAMALHLPVLVRLTDHNFVFSQAAAAGQDLRFVRGAKELAYEISAWDTIGGFPPGHPVKTHAADIWVKVDSISGNEDTVTINMYWGNPSATSASDGPKTFGSEAGFDGVWHMSESGKGAQGEYKDATGHNDGTGGNGDAKATPTRVPGVVGYGQDFRFGTTQGTIALPNDFDPGSDAWAFQAWVKPRGYTNGVIFQKGDAWQANEQRFQILCMGEGGNQIAVERAGAIYFTDVYLPTDKFSHLGMVHSNGNLVLYLDGVFFGSQAWTQGSKSVGRTVIGANSLQGDDEGFNGVLDELWFSYIGHSADWMRICYADQKIGSTMVTLLPFR